MRERVRDKHQTAFIRTQEWRVGASFFAEEPVNHVG